MSAATHWDAAVNIGGTDGVKLPTVHEFLVKELGADVARAMVDAGVSTFDDVEMLAADEDDLITEVFEAAGPAGNKLRRAKLRGKAFLERVAELRTAAEREEVRAAEVASRLAGMVRVDAVLAQLRRLRDAGHLSAAEYDAQRRRELRAVGIEVDMPPDDTASAPAPPPAARGLTVHPATADLFVQLVDRTTGASVGAPVPSNATPLRFVDAAPGDYDALFYVPRQLPVPGQPVDPVSAPGSFVISRAPLKLLSDKSTVPGFVDTGATEAIITSLRGDAPVTDGDTSFRNQREHPGFHVTRPPDGRGTARATLPPGTFIVAAPSGTEAVTVADRPLLVSAPQPADSGRGQQPITLNPGGTSFAPGLVHAVASRAIAVLGDVSGSMWEPLMRILRKSFREVAAMYPAATHAVRFFVWNTKTEMGPVDRGALDEWIDGIRAGGENDMRQAMLYALQHFAEAEDVIVMCDGDVTPFQDLRAWEDFAMEHPTIRFHFIALGDDADGERMKRMAAAGCGGFTRVADGDADASDDASQSGADSDARRM